MELLLAVPGVVGRRRRWAEAPAWMAGEATPSILIGPSAWPPLEYRRCLTACLQMGKVWGLISVFHGRSGGRICVLILRMGKEPVSVVARIRQFTAEVPSPPLIRDTFRISPKHRGTLHSFPAQSSRTFAMTPHSSFPALPPHMCMLVLQRLPLQPIPLPPTPFFLQ